MNDDVSAIPTTGCNVLTGEKALTNYNQNVRKDFVFTGGRWILTRTSTAVNPYNITGYECIDVSTLSTNAQMVPVYFIGGVAAAIFVFALLYRLVRLFS